MKTFVIPSWHPTPNQPFWSNWILPHIDLLRENGIDAYVLQLGLDDETIPADTDPWNQPVRFLNDRHLYVPVPRPTKRYQRTRFFYGTFLRKYLERLRDLYKLAVEKWGKPDILHAHVSLPAGWLAAQLGRENNLPVIVQEHYSGFDNDAKFWWRVGCFVKQMGRHIQGFYAVSPGFAERITRTGLVDVTGVLPNPVDTELFRPLPKHNSDNQFRIVSTGNMGWIKGTDILFESLGRLSTELDWSLKLFGDTSTIENYKQWLSVRDFAKRVALHGKVSQTMLAEAFSASDLYVVSSRLDNAQVSMTQAVACGVPVVTTRCGGTETLIDDSVGISVKANDPKSLSQGIMEMAQNRSNYKPAALRQFVQLHYSKQKVAQLITEAYQKAIEKLASSHKTSRREHYHFVNETILSCQRHLKNSWKMLLKHKIFVNTIVFLCSIAFSILLGEIILRIMYPNYLNNYAPYTFQLDQETGYKFSPNFKSVVSQPEFSIHIDTNRYGFRDSDFDEVSLAKKSLVILAIGDSFTLGYGVEKEQSFVEILENNINNNSGISCEVINTGVGGYGTLQEIRTACKYIPQFKPRLVLLNFALNDIMEDEEFIKNRDWEIMKGYLIRKPQGDKGSFYKELKYQLSTKSYIYKLAGRVLQGNPLIVRLKNTITHKKMLPIEYEQFKISYTPEMTSQWNRTQNELLEFNRFLKEHQIQLIITILPTKTSTSEKVQKNLMTAYSLKPEEIDFLKVNKLLKKFCDENSISFTDPASQMKNTASFYKLDGHFNPTGHVIVADSLYNFIRQNLLCKKDPNETIKDEQQKSI